MSAPSDPGMAQPSHIPSSYLGGRPLIIRPPGITVLTVWVGWNALINFQGGITSFADDAILSLISLGIAVFQAFVAYGLWYMKSWGGIAAITSTILGILVEGIIVMQVPELLPAFVISLIIGFIIIYYVYLKQDLFVN
jgi:hypothetical protein